MKIKIQKLSDGIFYMAYFLFLLYAFFGTIDIFKQSLKLLTNISMALTVIAFLIQIRKYNYKELIVVTLLCIISIIYIIKTDNYVLLKLVLIIILVKDIDFDKRVLFDIKLRIIFFVLMMVLFNLGIAQDSQALFNGQIRHSLGFTNPNVLGMHTLILGLEILYYNRNKLSFSKIALCFIMLLVSDYYSGSRTTLLALVFGIILFIVCKRNKKIFDHKVIKFCIINSPIILSIIVYIAYCLYINNNQIGILIDKTLSGRLTNIEFFQTHYSVNLFGNNIEEANKSLDTANAYALYAFGVSGLMLYMFGFRKLFKKLYKIGNYSLVIIMLVFILYGLSEKLWLFADCNMLVTTLSFIIFRNNENEIKKIGESTYEKLSD